MATVNDLAKPSAWVEGEAEAQNLIYALADAITNAQIPKLDGGYEENRWEKVYETHGYMWVTYKEEYRPDVVGKYKHTDGKFYNVYKLPDYTNLTFRTGAPAVDQDGYLWEVKQEYSNIKTGRKIQCVKISYVDETGTTIYLDVPGLLVTVVEDKTRPDGWACYVVKQGWTRLNGEFVESEYGNEFKIVCEMPSDWHYALKLAPGGRYWYEYERYGPTYNPEYSMKYVTPNTSIYKYTERYYVANPVHTYPAQVVLKAVPDVPKELEIPQREYYVMFEQPTGDYNYINVYQGIGFNGQNAIGDPKVTWEGICDPKTVKPGQTPVVIDQAKAQEMYEKWQDPATRPFHPPTISWEIDYDGVTEIVSPPAHYFHARNSTTPWLQNKKRRPDYFVKFWMSVNNDRVAMVIEGDPTPGIHDYYRSFAYIGKIVPFNKYDHLGNFGITVGMGDLDPNKTGFVVNDIKEETNPVYQKYGEYTSNGMYSMSMLRTRSNVLFQAYYPAFITQLPNYPSVGTLPNGLSRLILDKHGFQASKWTGKYHASPIYMVHVAEGYRGYLDGVVAIHDHNLVNLDELVVDTEIPKDPNDPTKGTWTEVYKFFSLKSPVNMFKYSPSPDVITVAILKEIK